MERAFFGTYAGRSAGIHFRPIVEADRPFLLDLYASTRESELAPVPWPPEAKRAFLAQQFAAQHNYYHEVYKDSDFLLILHGDDSIGRIYVHRMPGKICVVDIALLPQHCGQGIGTALLTELIDEARATSCEINLHVEPNNPAQRLYARLGFELVEHRGAYDYLVLPPAR
jgi:ribosomal protein S18 acetylase RimI-like enzyme